LATPLVAVLAYFAATDGLGHFWEAAIKFPATGIQKHYSFTHQVKTIHKVLADAYHFSAVLLLIGDLALIAVVIAFIVRRRSNLRETLRDPLVSIVFVTMIFELGYALYDFQGPPDVYPFLPYPPLGFAALVMLAGKWVASPQARRVVSAAALGLAVVLVGLSFRWFGNSPRDVAALHFQEADACGLERVLAVTGDRLYSLGDPVPLVLTHRVNPDRFIYLEEDVDRWKVNHTPGGFTGWTQQIAAYNPSVIVMQGWHGTYQVQMHNWVLSQGYVGRFIGKWHVFLKPGSAHHSGVLLTRLPTKYATGPLGKELKLHGCLSHLTAPVQTSAASGGSAVRLG
jgi:hypothetical protein